MDGVLRLVHVEPILFATTHSPFIIQSLDVHGPVNPSDRGTLEGRMDVRY
ncbi:MAG: hypothetical protein OXF07_06730 [Rhodobacter sp.]|nr:hypothetical protein [Rhodobacter sp.]MCY4242561.1 hypothetical protein [Rhodobacter sp.]